jgi:1-acyl-sn-glycerol-3-phosphate acyltransferase
LNIFLYNLGKTSFAVLFRLCFDLRVSGREHIPSQGGFIVASNHRSNFDPILIGVASSRVINFMAKEGLFKNRFFGWILKNVGAFPVKRHAADIGAIKEAIRRLQDGFGLLIFPEGTREQRREIDVQPGIGMLALKGKVAVVPAFISGSQEALPKGAKWFRSAKIRIFFGRPLFFSEEKPYPQIAHEVMAEINKLNPASD